MKEHLARLSILFLTPNKIAEELGALFGQSCHSAGLIEDYKVLRIDEVSPLDADFAEKPYALQGIYALYMDPAVLAWIGEQDVNVLLDFVGKANLPKHRSSHIADPKRDYGALQKDCKLKKRTPP